MNDEEILHWLGRWAYVVEVLERHYDEYGPNESSLVFLRNKPLSQVILSNVC
jgi:hypothetical protein